MSDSLYDTLGPTLTRTLREAGCEANSVAGVAEFVQTLHAEREQALASFTDTSKRLGSLTTTLRGLSTPASASGLDHVFQASVVDLLREHRLPRWFEPVESRALFMRHPRATSIALLWLCKLNESTQRNLVLLSAPAGSLFRIDEQLSSGATSLVDHDSIDLTNRAAVLGMWEALHDRALEHGS